MCCHRRLCRQIVSVFQKEIRQIQRHSSINGYQRKYAGIWTLSHIHRQHVSNVCESQERKKAGGQTHMFRLNIIPQCQRQGMVQDTGLTQEDACHVFIAFETFLVRPLSVCTFLLKINFGSLCTINQFLVIRQHEVEVIKISAPSQSRANPYICICSLKILQGFTGPYSFHIPLPI